ncbi:MAG: diguanylate cyclase [Spirochaetales bacterium]|nr:diguanylate cyclase [Spirochaetales bacterium]
MSLDNSGEIPIKYFVKTLAKLGIFLHNYATGESFTNDLWKSWGYTEEEMADQNWLDLLHPEDAARVGMSMKKITRGETDFFDEIYRIRTRGGEYRWLYSSGDFISREEDGSPALYMGADRDITDLKLYEMELSETLEKAEEKTLQTKALMEAGAALTSSLDLNKAIVMVLEKTRQVISYDSASVQLLEDDHLKILGAEGWPEDFPIMDHKILLKDKTPHKEILKSGRAAIVNDFSHYDKKYMDMMKDGIGSWMGIPLIADDSVMGLLSCNKIPPERFSEEDLNLATGIGGFIAIALRNALQHEQIKKLAITDSLTGLRTRRWFYEHGEQLLDLSVRYERKLAVMMLDLDYFKRVNDDFGHKAGDRVLVEVGKILLQNSRKSDLICRYGGEEFAMMLPETDSEGAETIAERIREGVEKLNVFDVSRPLTISIGISYSGSTGDESIDHLLDKADKALYMAKNRGRNCWISI